MSARFQVVLSERAAEQLRRLAEFAGQPPSTLAATLIGDALATAAAQRKLPSDGSASAAGAALATGDGETPAARARWLEPYGGDPGWRMEMWGQVVALHGRYPRHLAHLKDGWWQDDSHTETLCALALWREQLDEEGGDPREELTFQRQLAEYGRALRAEGGGVTKAWKPGAPPPEWTRQ